MMKFIGSGWQSDRTEWINQHVSSQVVHIWALIGAEVDSGRQSVHWFTKDCYHLQKDKMYLKKVLYSTKLLYKVINQCNATLISF